MHNNNWQNDQFRLHRPARAVGPSLGIARSRPHGPLASSRKRQYPDASFLRATRWRDNGHGVNSDRVEFGLEVRVV